MARAFRASERAKPGFAKMPNLDRQVLVLEIASVQKPGVTPYARSSPVIWPQLINGSLGQVLVSVESKPVKSGGWLAGALGSSIPNQAKS